MLTNTLEKKKSIITDLFFILMLNLVCHGLIMLVDGTFWDDWAFVDKNIDVLFNQFTQSGQIQKIFLILGMWLFPKKIYRVIIWIIYTAISIFFFLILKKSNVYSRKEALIVTALFIVIPVNSCRIMLCTIDYGFNFLLFMLSFLLMQLYLENNNIILRIISVLTLFLSFFQNSLVVFSIILYVYLVFHEKDNTHEERRTLFGAKTIKKYIDYILCPVLFVFIKLFLLRPSGSYENYASLDSGDALLYLPYTLISSIYMFGKVTFDFFRFITVTRINNVKPIPLMIVVIFFSALFLKKAWPMFKTDKCLLRRNVVGILSVCASLFTFVIAWMNPIISTVGVQSRYCLLLPVGISILLYEIISKVIISPKIKTGILLILIAFGILSTNNEYLNFQIEDIWQQSLASQLKENEAVSVNNTFILDNKYDLQGDYGNRFYSLNGVSKYYVFDNESRVYLYRDDYHDDYVSTEDYQKKMDAIRRSLENGKDIGYIMSDYNFDDIEIDYIIEYDMKHISKVEALYLILLEKTNPNEYKNIIDSLGRIEVVKFHQNQGEH